MRGAGGPAARDGPGRRLLHRCIIACCFVSDLLHKDWLDYEHMHGLVGWS